MLLSPPLATTHHHYISVLFHGGQWVKNPLWWPLLPNWYLSLIYLVSNSFLPSSHWRCWCCFGNRMVMHIGLTTNFAIPGISFIHSNSVITLLGNSSLKRQSTSYNQLCHLFHPNSIASFPLLTFSSITPKHLLPSTIEQPLYQTEE